MWTEGNVNYISFRYEYYISGLVGSTKSSEVTDRDEKKVLDSVDWKSYVDGMTISQNIVYSSEMILFFTLFLI